MNKYVFLIFWIVTVLGFAQKQEEVLPVYEKITYGTLKNGLQYYILPNSYPENRVEMYIAIKAGSILEDDDQQGLAHFVEHMAFNGSKHFKKNELVDFLRSLGVRFGADLNAYTSFDETVYMLHIPTDKKGAVEKGFLVLEDWAHTVAFEPEEVEKERNVIIEEWRLGQGAFERVRRKAMPIIYKGSRYAERLPIGKKEIILNAPRERLVSFYKDWYRPELMAVIIVGDIDAKEAEKKIKKHFGKIKNPKHPRERKYYDVPDNKEPLVAIATDKELPFSHFSIDFKQPKRHYKTQADYRKGLIDDLIDEIMTERYEPYEKEAGNGFNGANVGYSSFIGDKDAFGVNITFDPENIYKAFEIGFREFVRAYQQGFNDGELERAKKRLLKEYEKKFKEIDKTESRSWVWKILRHYLHQYPLPGPKFDYEFAKKELKNISAEDLHKQYRSYWKQNNRVITIIGPEKENIKYPSEKEVLEWIKKIEEARWAPLEDKAIAGSLLEKPLKKKVTSKVTGNYSTLGITELKLSNGTRIFLKPTNFKEDEIIIKAFSFGGRSVMSPEYDCDAIFLENVITSLGAGKFSETDLNKLLAGKKAEISFSVGDYMETISGKTSPEDVETFFQLLYLYITSPGKDAKTFEAIRKKNKMQAQMLLNMPQVYFFNEYYKVVSGNHPRAISPMDPQTLEKVSLKNTLHVFSDRFNNVGDFTFIIVGNFDTDKMKNLLETYLGNLPTKNETERYKDMGIKTPEGKIVKFVKKGSDPKSFTIVKYHGDADFTLKERMHLALLGEILSMRFVKKIREDKSWVYSISAQARIQKFPNPEFSAFAFFPSAPENIDSITTTIDEIIKDLTENLPTEDELSKAKKQILNDYEESEKKNSSWAGQISAYLQYNEPLTNIYARKEIINRATREDVRNIAKKYLTSPNYFRFSLYPENYKVK